MELVKLLTYARNMDFDQKPDYEGIRKLLKKIVDRESKGKREITFDWLENSINRAVPL